MLKLESSHESNTIIPSRHVWTGANNRKNMLIYTKTFSLPMLDEWIHIPRLNKNSAEPLVVKGHVSPRGSPILGLRGVRWCRHKSGSGIFHVAALMVVLTFPSCSNSFHLSLLSLTFFIPSFPLALQDGGCMCCIKNKGVFFWPKCSFLIHPLGVDIK